jgi:hypothetical protein
VSCHGIQGLRHPIRRHQAIVIDKSDPLGPAFENTATACRRESLNAFDDLCKMRNAARCSVSSDHLPGSIGAIVVDDRDRPVGVRVPLTSEPLEAPIEIGSTVIGADDDLE